MPKPSNYSHLLKKPQGKGNEKKVKITFDISKIPKSCSIKVIDEMLNETMP